MKIYLAEMGYEPEITEFEVIENKATYKVTSSRAIVGSTIWARSIRKDDKRICTSVFDAIMAIERLAKARLDVREEEFIRASEQWKIISEVSSAIRAEPEKLDKALEQLNID